MASFFSTRQVPLRVFLLLLISSASLIGILHFSSTTRTTGRKQQEGHHPRRSLRTTFHSYESFLRQDEKPQTVTGISNKQLPSATPTTTTTNEDDQDSVQEVQEFDCSSTVEQLDTIRLQMEWVMIGNDRSLVVNEQALEELEDLIVVTYNDLIFDLCDALYFRQLVDASVQMNNATNSVTLDITAECRNCTNANSNANSTAQLLFAITTSSEGDDGSAVALSRQGSLLDGEGETIRPSASATSCVCPLPSTNSTIMPSTTSWQFRAPTLKEFRMALSERITSSSFFNETAVTSIDVINEPLQQGIEVVNVNCSSDVRTFNSYAYVDFEVAPTADLDDLSTITEAERTALEENFRNAYNILSFQTCDLYFRTITDVSLQVPDLFLNNKKRFLQQQDLVLFGNNNNSNTNATMNVTANATAAPTAVPTEPATSRRETPAKFSIVGECRNCPVNSNGEFTLFDDALRRALSSVVVDVASRTSTPFGSIPVDFLAAPSERRELQQQDEDTCVCPADSQQQQQEGEQDQAQIPRQGAFLEIYNERLQEAEGQEGSVVQSVTIATNLQESKTVDCAPASETKDFRSRVLANATLEDLRGLTPADEQDLEEAFKDVYNRLAFSNCDGLFRRVVNVDVTINLPSSSSSSSQPEQEGDTDEEEDRLRRRGLQDTNSTSLFANHTNSTVAPSTVPSSAPSQAPSARRTSETVTMEFDVVGQCRNCQVTPGGTFTLFDDAIRRRLMEINARQQEGWMFGYDRALQEIIGDENACFCPVGTEPGEDQGPTVQEFQRALNRKIDPVLPGDSITLEELKEQTRADPTTSTPPPTPIPSPEPTPRPSPPPTFRPTPSPTDQPTTPSPTGIPATSPPTNSPTQPPTLPPTPQPTQIRTKPPFTDFPTTEPSSGLVCNEASLSYTENRYYVYFAGGETTSSNIVLGSAFVAAGNEMNKETTTDELGLADDEDEGSEDDGGSEDEGEGNNCPPILENALVEERRDETSVEERRDDEQGLDVSQVVDFYVASRQAADGSIFREEQDNVAFLTIFNSMLPSDIPVAVRVELVSQTTTMPTIASTTAPSSLPSSPASESPSAFPSITPTTVQPTSLPTVLPSLVPSQSPISPAPSQSPTTNAPSQGPSSNPSTSVPSQGPSSNPSTSVPSTTLLAPSQFPTKYNPTIAPSLAPTTLAPTPPSGGDSDGEEDRYR